MQQQVPCRQETVNTQFKNWGALKQVYRHSVRSHSAVFHMVAVITQLSINSGEKLFYAVIFFKLLGMY